LVDPFTAKRGTLSNGLELLDNALGNVPSQLASTLSRRLSIATRGFVTSEEIGADPAEEIGKDITDKPLTSMGPMGNAELRALNENLKAEVLTLRRENEALKLKLQKSESENAKLYEKLRITGNAGLPTGDARRARAVTFSEQVFKPMDPPPSTGAPVLPKVDAFSGNFMSGSTSVFIQGRSANMGENAVLPPCDSRRARAVTFSGQVFMPPRAPISMGSFPLPELDPIDGKVLSGSASGSLHGPAPNMGANAGAAATGPTRTHHSIASVSQGNGNALRFGRGSGRIGTPMAIDIAMGRPSRRATISYPDHRDIATSKAYLPHGPWRGPHPRTPYCSSECHEVSDEPPLPAPWSVPGGPGGRPRADTTATAPLGSIDVNGSDDNSPLEKMI
jgi:hypothetical protein